MPRAVLDTSVLFAAAYRPDSAHDDGIAIVRGIDSGSLPKGVVLDYVLAETLNGLTANAGHDVTIDFLERVEENAQFGIERLDVDAFATAKALFRRHEPLSFVDAAIVAHMQTASLEYLYAFDDDFDAVDTVRRLPAPTNPFTPE
jgi:predicted nucleic acid-binding protein